LPTDLPGVEKRVQDRHEQLVQDHTRFLDVRETGPVVAKPAQDRGWYEEVTLRIAPHPGLKDGQRRAIELDYGMVDGAVEVRTRVCLSSYLERHPGLDLDPSKVPAERQQIVLVNREEVEAARKQAGACESDDAAAKKGGERIE
jgi:hypothetical protein